MKIFNLTPLIIFSASCQAGKAEKSTTRKRTQLINNEVRSLKKACAKFDPFITGPAHVICSEVGYTALRSYMGQLPDEKIEDLHSSLDCQGSKCQFITLRLGVLMNYGCWCLYGHDRSELVHLGRGPALDEYDAICRRLTTCYKCVSSDSLDKSSTCDSFITEFSTDQVDANLDSINQKSILEPTFKENGEVAFDLTSESDTQAAQACQESNSGDFCPAKTCSCAIKLLKDYFKLMFEGEIKPVENLKHKNGFDYEIECPARIRSDDKICCGVYPNRKPYDNKDYRACCQGMTIYNPFRAICCEDGRKVNVGDVC